MAIERWSAPSELARNPIDGLARQIDDIFDRFSRTWPWSPWNGSSRGWVPAVDMLDRDDEIRNRVDVPGMREKDIDVSVRAGALIIQGESKRMPEIDEDDYHLRERATGSFSRTLSLPPVPIPTGSRRPSGMASSRFASRRPPRRAPSGST